MGLLADSAYSWLVYKRQNRQYIFFFYSVLIYEFLLLLQALVRGEMQTCHLVQYVNILLVKDELLQLDQIPQ